MSAGVIGRRRDSPILDDSPGERDITGGASRLRVEGDGDGEVMDKSSDLLRETLTYLMADPAQIEDLLAYSMLVR